MLVTKLDEKNMIQHEINNEPNPYKLLMDVIKQSNWPLDMVTFYRWSFGVGARLDSTDKKEIVIQY